MRGPRTARRVKVVSFDHIERVLGLERTGGRLARPGGMRTGDVIRSSARRGNAAGPCLAERRSRKTEDVSRRSRGAATEKLFCDFVVYPWKVELRAASLAVAAEDSMPGASRKWEARGPSRGGGRTDRTAPGGAAAGRGPVPTRSGPRGSGNCKTSWLTEKSPGNSGIRSRSSSTGRTGSYGWWVSRSRRSFASRTPRKA